MNFWFEKNPCAADAVTVVQFPGSLGTVKPRTYLIASGDSPEMGCGFTV